MSHGSSAREPASVSSTLLGRLRDQDAQAWEQLTNIFGPLVYHWCRRAGLRCEDAADVFQETFRAVARGLPGFRRQHPGSFRSWLATITRNKIRDHFRHCHGRPTGQGGTTFQLRLNEMPDSLIADDDESLKLERSGLFHRTLQTIRAEFEPNTWEAFWRATVDQQVPAEIADELKMSVGAVYKAKSRVLRRLREELHELL